MIREPLPGSCAHNIERLAECGWKPHRIVVAQTNLSRPSICWCTCEKQRGSVSSNSRFHKQYYFNSMPPTSHREPLPGSCVHNILCLGGTTYLSDATCLIRPRLFYVFVCRVKEHHNVLHSSPLLKKACVRQVVLVLGKWFSLVMA